MGWFWTSQPKRVCPNCRQPMQAGWLTCPHCPPPRASEPAPTTRASDPRTTMDVRAKAKPPVVGWLVALDGKHKGDDFRIVEGKNKIGRNADCQVVISDESIGGEHALISYDRDERHFTITDLAALNGTYVYENGDFKKINARELLDNDTIKLGETQLRFKCLG